MIKYLIVTLSVLTNLSLFGINSDQSANLSDIPDPGCFPGEVCDDC